MHYERTPTHQKEAWVQAKDVGGFAPAPPGFIALVPLPIESFCGQKAKGDAVASPLDRSRPLSRRSGCFPALPCPPLSPGLILLRREAGCNSLCGGLNE